MTGHFKWFLLVGAVAFLATASVLVYLMQAPVATASAAKWPMQVLNRLGMPYGPQIPAFDHIFVLVEENRNYTQVIGNADAPYINALAAQGSLATSYYSVHYSSLPNYLALTGGNTFVANDCDPFRCPVDQPNIADRIEQSGKTWKAYLESMPNPCKRTDQGLYAVRHDPFVYFGDIRTNAARCQSHVVPYDKLRADLKSTQTTPSFVWISPNLCNDMHNCSTATGDAWLKDNLASLFDSPAWKTQKSVLFILWDEPAGTKDNRVAMLALGSEVKPGYRSTQRYDHYSLLRTIESAWGLAPLTGNDANAPLIADLWQ